MTIWNKHRANAAKSACMLAITVSMLADGFGASHLAMAQAADPAPAAPAITLPDSGEAAAPPTPTAPALKGKITEVVIKGNQTISTDAIQAVLSQKVGDQYTQDGAEKDREAVKNMGYFNGDIGLNAVQTPDNGVQVIYTVVENPVIKKISFTANTPTGEPTIPADKLKSLMEIKEGQVLNTTVLVRDLSHLFDRQTGYVRSQGYIFDVSSDINIDPNSGTLTIPLIEAHIEAIQIKGNKKTKPVVITREMRSKAGDVLDERRLQKELTKVYNLGLFDQVGPFEEIPTDVGKVIISIPVVEKRSGQVSVGVGYSDRAKLVGRAELAENNFRGLGERVSLTWEVGGSSSQSDLELGFFEPYLDKHHTSLNANIYDRAIYRFASDTFNGTSGSNNTYIEKRRGAMLNLGRPLSDTFNVGISGRTEQVRANDVELPPEDLFIRQVGNVSALGLNATSNTRDNDISPAGGGLRAISLELGVANTTTVNNAPGPLQPGRHAFTKLGVDLRQYISLQGPRKPGDFREPKRVIAVRLLLGATNKNVPFFEQYFLGGADSLRGYQTDRYWGSKLALFQSELRIPIGKDNNLQGVLLADIGDAWGSIYQDSSLKQHDTMSLSSNFGFGVRLVTPIGPIRVDYAVGREGGKTQFSIGQSF
ncbi:MAG: BamA/TamA family outer membrane protein [Capsulimonas sp.]|uniref:BamA/OMP85 family outer membrane protein n=1 Tax=Capsulimonas sp. TaxID=2494211 RepID=UPI0032642CF1